MFKDDLSHLHSLGSFLNELAEVGDVVWHVDNDDLVTGHLWMEGTKRVTRMFEHLHNVGGEDGWGHEKTSQVGWKQYFVIIL